MSEPISDPAIETEYIAALDIGSNSFHFVLARIVEQHIQIVHSEKYQVRLASGLDDNNTLSHETIIRGLRAIESLTASTRHLTKKNFRVVATYTLRQAQNAEEFLKTVNTVFPFDIEIISGHEEARLIFQGVAHYTENNEQCLVMDIGGGSTECIIGKNYDVQQLTSLNIGCVSFQKRFFSDDIISESAFSQAITAAKLELDPVLQRFRKLGWQQCIGTSGTIKAIYNLINGNEEIPQAITIKQLQKLKAQVLEFSHVKQIKIDGLKDNRKPVLCGGLAILIALFESFDIKQLDYCQYALREGVLYELLSSREHQSVRSRTVDSLIERFNIDSNKVNEVLTLIINWLDAVQPEWQIKDTIYHELLVAAIKLHELGIDINTSGFHKHGHYIISNADLPGFNQEQQQALAWLVGSQRKKLNNINDLKWYLLDKKKLKQLCALIRLATLLCQQRQQDLSKFIELTLENHLLSLFINHQWLIERPIVDTELFYEADIIEALGLELRIKART